MPPFTRLPIFSVSWGGTRRFLFRDKPSDKVVAELVLKDGDLLVMGGLCQKTHKHEGTSNPCKCTPHPDPNTPLPTHHTSPGGSQEGPALREAYQLHNPCVQMRAVGVDRFRLGLVYLAP